MAESYAITEKDWEAYWLCDNSTGIVDALPQHVERVALHLSESFKGIIFIWDDAQNPSDGTVTICAVKPNKRKIAAKLEERMVVAGEKIAENVAKKYRVSGAAAERVVSRPGFLARLFGAKPIVRRSGLRPGWHYTPVA